MRSMVALEAGCSPAEVSLAVLGLPPAGLVMPWAGGHPAFALEHLAPVQMSRLDARARGCDTPGPFALGMAAARAVEAVVTASRGALQRAHRARRRLGVRNRLGSMPALLDAGGSRRPRAGAQPRERVRVETALGA
jgi:hypothetical protein